MAVRGEETITRTERRTCGIGTTSSVSNGLPSRFPPIFSAPGVDSEVSESEVSDSEVSDSSSVATWPIA